MTMAKGTTYVATAPDGSTHTRTSARTYTHAVLVFGRNWYAEEHNLPASWGLVSFNSREDLAVKEAAKWFGHYAQSIVVPVVAR
ncbi:MULTISPECIES: hypothetical protein [Mycobacteriaceae]|uniref:hypothetical protein n=1 Tax=Mycobacteriaceae TaxID=1762 RepID=UPI00096E36F7|nr:hypothetical protein [Mycolicibacterium conceptionense]OMB73171.1 hypothetical protein A5741_05485 [Mycolicibacterium conceptionense]